MNHEYLKFRSYPYLPVISQILIVAALFIVTTLLVNSEYQATGLAFGYPLSISLLFAPIYEEILFRGIILSTLLKKQGVWKAIIFSSLLFGIWHFKNIFYLDTVELSYQIFYTSVFYAPLMAFISIKMESIWPAVILHYLNNISFFLLESRFDFL
jgi:membrane protease YdiL (CAAX protease family)